MSNGADTTSVKAPRLTAPMSPARAVLAEMRPRQWTKNLIVFAALVFSGSVGDLHRLGLATATFAVFCLLSSAVYLFNDIADAELDRLHPVKRLRPIAAGLLGVRPAASSRCSSPTRSRSSGW